MTEAIQVREAITDPNKAIVYIHARRDESGKKWTPPRSEPISTRIAGFITRRETRPESLIEWCLDCSRMPSVRDGVIPYEDGEISQWTEFHCNSMRWLVQMKAEGLIQAFDYGRTGDDNEVAVFVVSSQGKQDAARSRYWNLLTRPSERKSLQELQELLLAKPAWLGVVRY